MTVTGTRRQAAKDRAYVYVKDGILRGEYPGGDLISEGEVSAALDMSRTPVREAFLRLEVEGLLRLYPQRGALVVPVSPTEIQDVLEARSVLEEFAVRKMTGRPAAAREPLAEELDRHLAKQRKKLDAGEFNAFLEEDRLFHSTVVGSIGNTLFDQFYTSLRDRQVRMVAASVTSDPERLAAILDEHAEIAHAVRAGDLHRARRAIRTHITSTRSALGM